MKNTFFEKGVPFSSNQKTLPKKAAPGPINGKKRGQMVKSVTYAGIYLVLNSLALDYMSGEELLTYIKGNLTMMAASTSSIFTSEKLADNLLANADEPLLNPVELVKKINSVLLRKTAKAA